MGRVTPLLTSHKVLNITYQTPQETLLETPETLPTAEPADPQVAYTVQESDLPTFDIQPLSKVFISRIIAGGQFITAGSCYWRMTKNGASVASGSFSVLANYFYVVEACFFDVNVGDVLGLKLWSNQVDSNWNRSAFEVRVSRIYALKTSLYKDVTIVCVGSASFQNFSAGISSTSGYTYVYNGHSSLYYRSSGITGFTLSGISFLACVSPNGMIQVAMGDATVSNTARTGTSSSSTYSVYRFPVPSQIVFRGVYLN